MPGSGEQGTLHCRALQDRFFRRSLLSRSGDWLTFLTHRNRPRELLKMRRERIMSQMKVQVTTTAQDLSKMDISKMPDKEFKIMIIKLLTGLERSGGHQ